jgi:hypothetical protein
VQGRERLEAVGSFIGQGQAHRSGKVTVGIPLDQTGGLRTINESDRAVVAQQEVVRDIADRGTGWIWMAPDGKQQLVLSGRQILRPRLLLAPAQERRRPVLNSSRRR